MTAMSINVPAERMNREVFSFANLSRLYRRLERRPLTNGDRYVIFSDLHLGNGSGTDDFAENSDMFISVLGQHYFPAGHTLILNGDIEELQRFRLPDIMQRWAGAYALFEAFENEGRFYRIFGNHDFDLTRHRPDEMVLHEGLRFAYGDHDVFVFHGHQTSKTFVHHNRWVEFGLRYIANPLKIKNYSVAHNSMKRFRTERRVYEFASRRKVMSIIGHTHRPLFESMSKVDTIKFEIERLCRKYPKAGSNKRRGIESRIESYKKELRHIREHDGRHAEVASLYNANLVVPCMFNSGTVVGKRGMTCLEIVHGQIALVHWFDSRRSEKYLKSDTYNARRLHATPYFRVVMKEENLDYIFSRITLLS